MSWVNERVEPILAADRSDRAFVAVLREAYPERERQGFVRRPYCRAVLEAERVAGTPEEAPAPAPPPPPPPPVIEAAEPATPKLSLADRLGRVGRVIAFVARSRGLNPIEITGPARTRDVVTARNIAAEMLVSELGLSQNRVGKLLNRDHTTIFWGRRELRIRIARDPEFAEEVAQIRAAVREALGRPA